MWLSFMYLAKVFAKGGLMTKLSFLSATLILLLSCPALASATPLFIKNTTVQNTPSDISSRENKEEKTSPQLSGTPSAVASADMSSGPAPKADKDEKISTPTPISPSQQRLANIVSQKFHYAGRDAEMIVKVAHEEAKKHGVDPVLVLSIIAAESSFNRKAHSSAGAMGLMQAIPRWHGDKMRRLGVKHHQMYNVRENITLGTSIFREYLRLSNGQTSAALQRYNGSMRDKNQRYSRKVMSFYQVFSGN